MKWCVPLLITAVHLTAAQKPGVITEYSTATLPLLNRTLDDVYRRIGNTTSGRVRQVQWPSAVDRLTVYRQLDSLGYTFLATAMVGPGWTHASTDTLRVRGKSLFSGQVKIDGRLGVGVDPQDNSMVVVRQFSVPYAVNVHTDPDPATNACGVFCNGAWGTAGVWASNAYPAGYDIYGNSAGIGAVGIYTPLIAPRKDGTDRYVRISTAVAIDPHSNIGSGGTTIGLLDLRSSNKFTALYIEGSYTGITIASGRTVGINDFATYSRHQGYLLVDSSITTPLIGNGGSPFTAEGTSLTVRSGTRFIGINASGIFVEGNARFENTIGIGANPDSGYLLSLKGNPGNIMQCDTSWESLARQFVQSGRFTLTNNWNDATSTKDKSSAIASSIELHTAGGIGQPAIKFKTSNTDQSGMHDAMVIYGDRKIAAMSEFNPDTLKIGGSGGSVYPYLTRDSSDGGLLIRSDSNPRAKFSAGGNLHISNQTSIGYWIDASTSYRWGMYRNASANLVLRGNDYVVDGLAVCRSSVVSLVEFAAVNNSKVIVQISSAQTFTATTKVWYSSVVYDQRGDYDRSQSRFTAPHTGLYYVTAQTMVYSTWVPTSVGQAHIYVGGTEIWTVPYNLWASYRPHLVVVTGMVYAVAGQEIEFRLGTPTFTTVTIAATDPTASRMSIFRVP